MLIALLAATAHAAPPLAPYAYTPLPVGSVTPKGWLLKQLTLQAEGLSGHLAQFWNDIMNSVWIGGSGDGGLHERTPYWLNGMVPLAFLLRNAGIEELDPVVGIYKAPWGPNGCMSGDGCEKLPKPTPVNVMSQVESYVSYILAHQGADGWLGPAGSGGDQYWGPSNVLQTLWQYAEAKNATDPAAAANASRAVLLHLLEQHRRMPGAPLQSWANARWIDMALSAEWLLDHGVARDGAEAAALLDLVALLKAQGEDWDGWFEGLPGGAANHNVNVAQGLKSAAVWARFNASATREGRSMAELSRRRMEKLDAALGLPTGMYVGDELTPSPVTRSPSRGIELCGVVEAMYSYEVMWAAHGDAALAERAERIAYNALPATWASPTGGDMWAHQYLQAINQINAIKADPHVWTHDGDLAETYGLEPNYGCCTANFHQGWPKLANALFHTPAGGGVVVSVWAPASAALPGGGSIDVATSYPFGDDANVTVRAAAGTPVLLRIPSWAARATVNGAAAANGTLWRGAAGGGASVFAVRFRPATRLEEWDGGAVSVHRGALLFSLPLAANYTVYAHHFGDAAMSNDYYLQPTAPWGFALDVDPAAPDPAALVHRAAGYRPGAAPFNHSNWPATIAARLRPLPSWGTALHSAAEPPTSPACTAAARCGPAEVHELVPHGGTELRVGELPVASFGPGRAAVGRAPAAAVVEQAAPAAQ